MTNIEEVAESLISEVQIRLAVDDVLEELPAIPDEYQHIARRIVAEELMDIMPSEGNPNIAEQEERLLANLREYLILDTSRYLFPN